MTKKFHINTTADLMDFIKREEVSSAQAIKVVCSVFKLINLHKKTKSEVIELTNYFIEAFSKNNFERPIFFERLEYKFTLDDVKSTPEGKKIIDGIEAKYLD
jgi:methylthioribose-1-phosphate isomerase